MKIFKNLKRYTKRLTAHLSVLAVLMLTTVSPVFADSVTVPVQSSPSPSECHIVQRLSSGNKDIYFTTMEDGVYPFCVYDSTSMGMSCIFASTSSDAKYNYYEGTSIEYTLYASDSTTSNTIYYRDIGWSNIVSVEGFNDLTSIVGYSTNGVTNYSNILQYIVSNWDALTSTTVPTQGYTKIEAGNIVYFDMGTSAAYDLSMQSAFYSYSGVLSGTWPDDNRRYGFVDELPTANTNFAESAGTSILWTDDTDGQTILGTNNKGVATISGTTTGRYMWVINPLYNNKYYDDALNAMAINGVMKVYGVPAGTTVYTYKLKQNATSLGLDNVIPSVSGGVGTVSENEGQETPFTSTDDNETPYTQTVGGDTSAPETVTAIEGVRQTLQQFVDMFLNLFTAPADYIQQLISAGSAFMQAISGIFTWLPSPVVDVFVSALVLMIVIGVLKMLL